MWTTNWREVNWSQVRQAWDILIVGGGITGAGILREASRLGFHSLLVEQRDFASGASSRSSKLVHGGLRYLKDGQFQLARDAVRQRERLLKEYTDLVTPVGFLFPTYKGKSPGPWSYRLVLSLSDLFASRWDHQHYHAGAFQLLAPHIAQVGLTGGFRIGEAQTDDACLVLRVLREAVDAGGMALNYVQAEALLWQQDQVVGVRLCDREQDRTAEVYAKVVINATGAWADRLRGKAAAQPHLRPLRGSHLIFPAWRLPVPQALGWAHPLDHRPVSLLPWEGITLVGTTDSDYTQSLDEEPAIQPEEVAYLMAALEDQFPSLQLTLDDVIATFSGVRPVIGTGQADPSKEGRDHVVWEEKGLLTVTGGKLTTFHLMVADALKAVGTRLPKVSLPPPALTAVDSNEPGLEQVEETTRRRLLGRYGADTLPLLALAHPGELEAIPGTHTLWAEVRWAAHAGGVVHLDDLLLRRVRLGLLLPHGGRAHLPTIRTLSQAELGWTDERWQQEEETYLTLVRTSYSLPARSTIPDWHSMLKAARTKR
ncbi:MAG: glycerol-3-phosphate dehydrogenase/oxidase [Ktedonobacteraceae bacterium]